MSGRDEIREKETAIGNVGEVQAVLTGQAFGFVEGADCVYGCWEELERGNGNVGSRVGEALGRNQRYLFNCRVRNHQWAGTYGQKAQGNRSHKLGDGDGARHGSDRCNAAPAVYIKLDKDEMGLSSESRCPELKPASRIL